MAPSRQTSAVNQASSRPCPHGRFPDAACRRPGSPPRQPKEERGNSTARSNKRGAAAASLQLGGRRACGGTPRPRRQCVGRLPEPLEQELPLDLELRLSLRGGAVLDAAAFQNSIFLNPYKDFHAGGGAARGRLCRWCSSTPSLSHVCACMLRVWCAVRASPDGPPTFVLGLCAEVDKTQGWALSVVSALSPGDGHMQVLDGGPEEAHLDLIDSGHVALTVVKCRVKALRAALGCDLSQAQDLFLPTRSVKVSIGPDSFARSGTSGREVGR